MSDMIWNGSYTLGDSQETQITAGTGIKVTTPAAGQIQVAADETVLFESTTGGALTGSFTEELTNFSYIEFFFNRVNTTSNSNLTGSLKIAMIGTGVPSEIMLHTGLHSDASTMYDCREYFNLTNSSFAWSAGYNALISSTGTAGIRIYALDFKNFGITKVIGINRISGGN